MLYTIAKQTKFQFKFSPKSDMSSEQEIGEARLKVGLVKEIVDSMSCLKRFANSIMADQHSEYLMQLPYSELEDLNGQVKRDVESSLELLASTLRPSGFREDTEGFKFAGKFDSLEKIRKDLTSEE
jgi:hypothetical protein